MALMWRKQLEIGDEAIDNDHKYLICLINTVELTLRTPEHRDLLPVTLEQLTEYTIAHFKREESIMLLINYPRYYQHKQQHQLLIRDLGDIQQKILARIGGVCTPTYSADPQQKILVEGKGEGDFSAEECAELAKLVHHGIEDHLIKEDMLLMPSLTCKTL